jgi:hypothetical protein
VDAETGSEIIYIGRSYMRGTVSVLIRFDNLPTLPPGYGGAGGSVGAPRISDRSLQSKQLRFWQVTSAWTRQRSIT